MTLQQLIHRSRIESDQFTLEETEYDDQVVGGPNADLSDEDIVERINSAVLDIIRTTDAQNFQHLIKEYTGPWPRILVQYARILYGRVFEEKGGRAVRKELSKVRQLRRSGRGATEEFPVYAVDNDIIEILPAPGKLFYIELPPKLTMEDLNEALTLDERFDEALVFFVTSSIHASLKNYEKAGLYNSLYQDELTPFRVDVSGSGLFDERETNSEN